MGNNMRKRDTKGKEINDISKEEILNDQEQDELIKKLRDQDNFLNNLFKVLPYISTTNMLYFFNPPPNPNTDTDIHNPNSFNPNPNTDPNEISDLTKGSFLLFLKT